MEVVVRTARTVEEAEELALKELGADRSEVEVEILSRGKVGFLGIGAEAARVRVTRRSAGTPAAEPSPEAGEPALTRSAQPVAAGVESVPAAGGDGENAEAGTVAHLGLTALRNILTTAGVEVNCVVRTAHDPVVGGPVIDVIGEDSGLLIGRRGQTLHSLQFIVNLIVRNEFGEGVRVALDVEHYRQRREASLKDMAYKVAERVTQTGRSITLEPMSAADRRIIHVSLADRPGVSTESVGYGDDRKVSIIPSSQGAGGTL